MHDKLKTSNLSPVDALKVLLYDINKHRIIKAYEYESNRMIRDAINDHKSTLELIQHYVNNRNRVCDFIFANTAILLLLYDDQILLKNLDLFFSEKHKGENTYKILSENNTLKEKIQKLMDEIYFKGLHKEKGQN